MKDHISICICTFHRNQSLERLLRNLNLQETGGLFDFSIVIIDNDASGPARSTVVRLSSEIGISVDYDIEPEQTIPAARNRALRLAQGNYIGIIDDDEFPAQNWLITLYKAIQTFDVDGSLGPVFPFFEQKPPAWLLKSRICERPVYRTGTLLEWKQTRTGNVLLKRAVFDERRIYFDLEMKTSSSDRAFFKQAMHAGYRFVAVEGAPVFEIVPPERWTKSYYIKRELVHGFNAYRNNMSELHGILRVTTPLKSILAFFAYLFASPFCMFLGNHVLVKCLRGAGYHMSYLLGMLGIELIKKRDF